MSCLACKIYEPSAWRAMTGPFIQHQLVAPQQKLGTDSLLLIFGRAPAPEIFALHPAGKLTSRLPKRGGESDYSVIVTCDQLTGSHCCLIYVLPSSFIASLRSASLSATAQQHSHPSGNTLWRARGTWMSTCARRLVYVSGTLQWINHLDHHLHLGYSLDCSTSFPI